MTLERRNEYLSATKLLECLQPPLLLYELESIMVELTRQHWAHPENHGKMADMFACAAYNFEAPSISTMLVDFQDSYIEEEITSPGIYIAGLEAPIGKVAIGNLQGISDDNATTDYVWRCNTGVIAAHVNPSTRLAKAAAESTLSFWAGIGQPLADRLGLTSFVPQKISAATKLEKSPDRMYRVDAVAQIVYTWSVSVNQETHRLKILMSELNPIPYPDQ
jgi:hypothetical protein